MKQSYTTGEAAHLCGLGRSTLKRWIQRGALRAYRTPGGNLRILREHLLDFMKAYEIPMLGEEESRPILLLDLSNKSLQGELQKAAEYWGDAIEVRVIADELDLGYAIAHDRPRFVVFEGVAPERNASRCASIRHLLAPDPVRVGLVLGAGEAASKVNPERMHEQPEVIVNASGEWAGRFLQDLLGRSVKPVRPKIKLLDDQERTAQRAS